MPPPEPTAELEQLEHPGTLFRHKRGLSASRGDLYRESVPTVPTVPTALADLLERLEALDVVLRVEDGRLRYDAPAGVMTPELLDALRSHKPALIEMFAGEAGPTGAFSANFASSAGALSADEPESPAAAAA